MSTYYEDRNGSAQSEVFTPDIKCGMPPTVVALTFPSASGMSLDQYQEGVRDLMIYRQGISAFVRDCVGRGTEGIEELVSAFALCYSVLGLTGEAGEVANKVKKILRDKCGRVNDADKYAIGSEVGGTLWYVAAAAHELGTSLSSIAHSNLTELQSRKARGKIQGSGDNR